MNHDVTHDVIYDVIHALVVSWLCCVPLCTCCSWITLALGCPTHICSWLVGTWLPNISDHMAPWHLVAQLYALVYRYSTLLPDTSSAHGCPTRDLLNSLYIHLRSRWASFLLAVILCDIYAPPIVYPAAICATPWTYYTSSSWSGWTVYICLPWTLLLYGHQFIGTPVRPDFSTFHVYSMTLQYYHSSSSRRFTVFSVLHRCVEPFLISWLSGHYAML